MLKALGAARDKLAQYYRMTDDVDGDLYAIGTIVAPHQKLQFFNSEDWNDPDKDWRGQYRKSLEDYSKPYKQRLSSTQSQPKAQSSVINISELEKLCEADEESEEISPALDDELTQYLGSGKFYAYLQMTEIN